MFVRLEWWHHLPKNVQNLMLTCGQLISIKVVLIQIEISHQMQKHAIQEVCRCFKLASKLVIFIFFQCFAKVEQIRSLFGTIWTTSFIASSVTRCGKILPLELLFFQFSKKIGSLSTDWQIFGRLLLGIGQLLI